MRLNTLSFCQGHAAILGKCREDLRLQRGICFHLDVVLLRQSKPRFAVPFIIHQLCQSTHTGTWNSWMENSRRLAGKHTEYLNICQEEGELDFSTQVSSFQTWRTTWTFSIPRSREQSKSGCSQLQRRAHGSESEAGGRRKSCARRSVHRGGDDRPRPAMALSACALLTASDAAMQRQREEAGGGHNYRCRLTPITLILWCKMTIIRQSHTDMIE